MTKFEEFKVVVMNAQDENDVLLVIEISHNGYKHTSERYGVDIDVNDIRELFFDKFCDINDGWEFDVAIKASTDDGVIATLEYSDCY